MNEHRIELVYFDRCPNVGEARENLRSAVGQGDWREWNLSSGHTPARFRRWGSPTVLVDGKDVTGHEADHAAMACRADGAPSVEAIRKALV